MYSAATEEAALGGGERKKNPSFFSTVRFMRTKIGFICQKSYEGRKTAGSAGTLKRILCPDAVASIRQGTPLIHQPGDQADCRRIGSHIWNINALDGNERASARVKWRIGAGDNRGEMKEVAIDVIKYRRSIPGVISPGANAK